LISPEKVFPGSLLEFAVFGWKKSAEFLSEEFFLRITGNPFPCSVQRCQPSFQVSCVKNVAGVFDQFPVTFLARPKGRFGFQGGRDVTIDSDDTRNTSLLIFDRHLGGRIPAYFSTGKFHLLHLADDGFSGLENSALVG